MNKSEKERIREIIIHAVIPFVLIDVLLWSYFFSLGKAKGDGYYYIDTKGKIVNSRPFNGTGTPFNEDGIAFARQSSGQVAQHDGFMNTKGQIIGEYHSFQFDPQGAFTFPHIITTTSGLMEVIDKDMKIIASKEFGKGRMKCYSDFSNGASLVSIDRLDSSGVRFGYLNADLEWVLKPQYLLAYPFTDEKLAAVMDSATGKWGFIDLDGKFINDERYCRVSPFSGGYALVQKDEDGKAAYINTDGDYITSFVFDFDKSQKGFSEGMAYVKYFNEGGYGYINEKGEMAIDISFGDAGEFSHGLAPVKNEKYVYIDKTGKTVIDGDFIRISRFSKDGYAAVVQDDKYGIIDANGEWLFEPQFLVEDYDNSNESNTILACLGVNVDPPDVENGYCIVYLKNGQRVKKPKAKWLRWFTEKIESIRIA